MLQSISQSKHAKRESWGRHPQIRQSQQHIHQLSWLSDIPDLTALPGTVLAYGQGRSYGDCCLNAEGTLLDTSALNRFISFDPDNGVLRCEAGVSFKDILALIVPHGWFLPVTPGTQFVSVGGAIANDIHGKNHHQAGSFGCYVRQFALLRSDGCRLICSANQHPDLFRATIGGLGLTGLILWAEIQLTAIPSSLIDMQVIKFANLTEFFALTAESDSDYAYTVSWVDCFAQGEHLGRGLFIRGNFAEVEDLPKQTRQIKKSHQPEPRRLWPVTVPIDVPAFVLNTYTLKLFNWAYYHKQYTRHTHRTVSYLPFFYPLDAIGNWNRLYGPQGFFQHQCVVPFDSGKEALTAIMTRIAASGLGSFLAVLKTFGRLPSPGLLSFPRPGFTFALDFPNQGQKTLRLLEEIDAIVRDSGGAVYPAKDARMSAKSFQTFFPDWEVLESHRDPKFSSSFWRRVTGETHTA
jgi:FAD/FMN-containing dehydrogenase